MFLVNYKINTVFAVVGDYGNAGPGVVLGLFEDEKEAQKNTKDCGSCDCGGDGHVEQKFIIELPDGTKYLLADEDPVQLNILKPSMAKKLWESFCFSVVLKNVGTKRIETMKFIRSLLGLELKVVKDLVDRAPTVISKGLTELSAMELKSKLESLGATTEVIPDRIQDV